MRGELLDIDFVVPEKELHAALEDALCRYFGRDLRVRIAERRVSQYCSSYILEELDVVLCDGSVIALIFKDLSSGAVLEGAGRVKPKYIYDPTREIETYRKVLSRHRLGTPTCYGAVVEPKIGRYWLFIERLPPELLWQMGEFAFWEEAARWLAGMHCFLIRETETPESAHIAHLLQYDEDFYRGWMSRAQAFVAEGDTTPGRAATAAIERLASRYEAVVEHLLALPVTVIHGEFFASNILVHQNSHGLRISPVDWEMAAIGPGLVDLAGLTSGDWTSAQREAMALAYHGALPAETRAARDARSFLTDFEYCRLHQAVQWLGWSPGWTPPPEHAHDWFREAICSAEKLGLMK